MRVIADRGLEGDVMHFRVKAGNSCCPQANILLTCNYLSPMHFQAIFSNLEPEDVYKLRGVCTAFKAACAQVSAFRLLCPYGLVICAFARRSLSRQPAADVRCCIIAGDSLY